MFDFVSPFDALASVSTSSFQKKADTMSLSAAESRDTDDSWTAISDPKRKSVENLMDQLTRSQGPVIPTQQQFDVYGSEPGTPPNEPAFQSKDVSRRLFHEDIVHLRLAAELLVITES